MYNLKKSVIINLVVNDSQVAHTKTKEARTLDTQTSSHPLPLFNSEKCQNCINSEKPEHAPIAKILAYLLLEHSDYLMSEEFCLFQSYDYIRQIIDNAHTHKIAIQKELSENDTLANKNK